MGRTAQAAGALREGLAEGGADVEVIMLTELKIEHCRQEGQDGWGKCLAEGRCSLEDGFAGLVEKVRQADLAVFATPVYWGDLSESMRAFLDRLRRICVNEDGRKGIKGKPAAGICVAGGGGGGSPDCAVSMQRVLDHCGFDVLDVIPARRQNLDLKLKVLKETGRWLAARQSRTG